MTRFPLSKSPFLSGSDMSLRTSGFENSLISIYRGYVKIKPNWSRGNSHIYTDKHSDSKHLKAIKVDLGSGCLPNLVSPTDWQLVQAKIILVTNLTILLCEWLGTWAYFLTDSQKKKKKSWEFLLCEKKKCVWYRSKVPSFFLC